VLLLSLPQPTAIERRRRRKPTLSFFIELFLLSLICLT